MSQDPLLLLRRVLPSAINCCFGARRRRDWQSGSSSLVLAAQNGHINVVRMLLEGKANVDLQNKVVGCCMWELMLMSLV